MNIVFIDICVIVNRVKIEIEIWYKKPQEIAINKTIPVKFGVLCTFDDKNWIAVSLKKEN